MGKRKRGGKAKAPLLVIEHREQRGDYASYSLGTPGTKRCSTCWECRGNTSFVDAGPSRYLHHVSCMRARCRSHPCARCCDLQCAHCRKYIFVRCPCCDGPRKCIKDPDESHYPDCCRVGKANARFHSCSVPDVQPNVIAADLGSGAPAEEPARQVVGELEAKAGEAAEPADPPRYIGGVPPLESEASDSPSDGEEGREVCCFCFASVFHSLEFTFFLVLGRR
jgi:hypothetical protein